MIKKSKYNKLLNFSSITIGSSINTFCAEDSIELDDNSFITVNDYTTSLKGFKLKKNTEKIEKRTDLLKYFLDNFSDLKFNNVEYSEDKYNGENLKDLFKLEEHFNNNKLFIKNINGMFEESFNDVEADKKKILDDVFTNRKLCLYLKTFQKVSTIIDNSPYNLKKELKKEFKDKLEEVNNEIKIYSNVGQIKDLMASKGFEKDKINIKDVDGNEIEDNVILNNGDISVNYNDCISNYLGSKTAKIEFIAGDGLVLDKKVKNYEIDFVKDNITEDTEIFNFITDKFKGLSNKNCKIEYFNYKDNIWNDVEEGNGFDDEDKIRITINAEVKDFTIKENSQNPPKKEDQQNQDNTGSGNDSESGNNKGGCCNKCSGGNKNE